MSDLASNILGEPIGRLLINSRGEYIRIIRIHNPGRLDTIALQSNVLVDRAEYITCRS